MPDTDNKFIHRLDERLDDIGERVSKIEGKIEEEKSKGFKKQISEYGGIVALVLSIIIATFTVYDKVVLEPKKNKQLQIKELRTNLDDLSSLVAQIASLDWENNPSSAIMQAGYLSPKRISLLKNIEQLRSSFTNILTFSDYLLVANEYETFGQFDKACKEIEKALQIAKEPLEQASAYWRLARLNGKLKKFSQMRDTYIKSIDTFKNIGFEQTMSIMQVYIEWIGFELTYSVGCVHPKDIFQEMVSDYNNSNVSPQIKAETVKQFNAMLSQVPKKCNLTLN